MDLEMPEMNGLQATRAIRDAESEGDRIPIIALTAKATKADREQCMAVGMNEYVAKPVDPRVLYHLVESYPSRQAMIGTTVSSVGPGEQEETVDTTESDEIDGSQSVVDWQVARKLTAGDETILVELVELFPDESSRQLLAARDAIAAQDAESLTRAAHSLKSAAGFFAAKKLVALALEVEMMGKAGQISDAENRMADLEAATRAVVEALKGYSPSQDAGP
jgi:CheY-like chemotaxis protein